MARGALLELLERRETVSVGCHASHAGDAAFRLAAGDGAVGGSPHREINDAWIGKRHTRVTSRVAMVSVG